MFVTYVGLTFESVTLSVKSNDDSTAMAPPIGNGFHINVDKFINYIREDLS